MHYCLVKYFYYNSLFHASALKEFRTDGYLGSYTAQKNEVAFH